MPAEVWKRRTFFVGKILGAQSGIQLLSFCAGILVVRLLTKEQYAIYTVGGAMLGLITNLSDLGASNALLAIGGKVWEDPSGLGSLIQSARKLRRFFLGIAVVVIMPPLIYLSAKAGATSEQIVFLGGIIAIAAICQLSYSIWAIAPRLHMRIPAVQGIELSAAALRVMLIGAGALIGLTAVRALSINAMALGLQALLITRLASKYVDRRANASIANERSILSLVRSQLPNAIFYCFYGQATVVVITLFGHKSQIADIGALGRFGVLLGVVNSAITAIVLPRFARARWRRDIVAQYAQTLGVFVVIALVILGVSVLFPEKLLFVLGSKYAGLDRFLAWMIFGTLINTFVGLVWSMNAARGWTHGSWITIPAILTVQAFLAVRLNLSSIEGAILFASLPSLAALLVLFSLATKGMRAVPTNADESD